MMPWWAWLTVGAVTGMAAVIGVVAWVTRGWLGWACYPDEGRKR